MKERNKEALESRILRREEFDKAIKEIKELNICEKKAIEILRDIYEEEQDVVSMFIYKKVYEEAIRLGKDDTEILTTCIETSKYEIKKIKKVMMLNYAMVGLVAFNLYLGAYNLLITKIFGIGTLLLSAYNHYSYTKRKELSELLLDDLLKVKELLPKLRDKR